MTEKKEIIYRKDKIIEVCVNKSVLHLGFIQHSDLYENLIKSNGWLHKKINYVAKKLVGIDYLNDDIEKIKSKYGYECYFGDVTNLSEVNLKEKFDVIVCGELIEHLENPGLMMDGIKKFMTEDSLLIITTPNPWSKLRIKLIKKSLSEDKWVNKEHTCWFSYQTLKQLLERKGYKEVGYYYYFEEEQRYSTETGVIGFLKYLKRTIRGRFINSNQYDGLFFISKLG